MPAEATFRLFGHVPRVAMGDLRQLEGRLHPDHTLSPVIAVTIAREALVASLWGSLRP